MHLRYLVAFMALITTAASAQPTLDRVYDDKLLASAVSEIGKMPLDELRSFTDALVSCFPIQKQRTPHCEERSNRFLIEYDRARGVDVVWQNFIVVHGMEMQPNDQRLKFISRAYVIYNKLSDALRDAFKARYQSR